MLELLLTIGLSALLLPILFASLMSSRDGKFRQTQQAQAVAILKETEEAVRGVKNAGWSNLPEAGTYYPMVQGSVWALVPGASSSGGFSRQVVISEVRRDPDSGEIVPSGGFVDPSTKKVDITVNWTEPHASSIDSSFYLTRNDNMSRVGGLSDFLAGSHTQTQATSSAGGRVMLEYNTKGQWCSPAFARDGTGTEIAVALPDGPPVALAATAAASTTTPNDIFVATAPNTSNSIKFSHIRTTANTSFPQSSVRGVFTLDPARYSDASHFPAGIGIDNNFKTNNVVMYRSPGGKLYALMTTNLPDKEVIAVLANDNNSLNDNTNDGEFQDYEASPKIYKYHTFFNTNMYKDAVANYVTGYVSASNNAAVAGGDNNGYQTNASNAYGNDSNYAADPNSGTNNSIDYTNAEKDKHDYWGYNIVVPGGATLKGIEVRVDARTGNNCAATRKIYAQLSWDGGVNWTDGKTHSNNLSTSNMSTNTIGGSTDLWGRSWNVSEFDSSKLRLRLINVASDIDCEFRLDYASVRVHYSTIANDQAAFGHGATALTVFENKGYVASGGYLYVFDLSNIDTKSAVDDLDQYGCRILINGFECQPGYGTDLKYSEGESGTTWTSSAGPAHPESCYDGGNIELYSTNDIYPVKSGANTYIFGAIGAGTMPEFEVVDVSTVPSVARSAETACGRGADTGWRKTDDLDFRVDGGEEAANSVYAKSDGTRAYISSNGGDAKQFYILNTTNKSDVRFLTGSTASPPSTGFYYGNSPNDEMYARKSLTVLNGKRAVLVGRDSIANGDNAQEYQVLDIENEANVDDAQAYCGGLDYDDGFRDLTGVAEADGDNFVYMISGTGNNELKIIQGGPDGTFVDWGSYTSPVIDIGYSTIFNRFTANTVIPTNSSLDFQFAVASPAAGQTCADVSYEFTGPGGSASARYATTSAAIWVGSSGFYKNPGRCIRYRTTLSTNNYEASPELKSMIINFAP